MTRILHTPTNIGNHPWNLSRAERALGLQSDVVDFVHAPWLDYQADAIYDLAGKSALVHGAVRSSFLARAVRRYDVFHFNAGQPLVPLRARGRVLTELGLLRRLGKTVIVTWQGCDVRPMAACCCSRPECEAQHMWRAPQAAAMLRHADRAFFLNPDLARYLPGASFLPYASVDVRAIEPLPLPVREEVVIAHAPTNRDVKGTSHVLAAVDALRGEGLPVRLDLVEGLAHEVAMERIAAADLLVDQLVLGWYGGVAVEAMALGRPVVCHVANEGDPFGERLPIVRATRESLREVLRPLVQDRSERGRLAAASREFVLAEHDPQQVARRVLDGLVPLPA